MMTPTPFEKDNDVYNWALLDLWKMRYKVLLLEILLQKVLLSFWNPHAAISIICVFFIKFGAGIEPILCKFAQSFLLGLDR